MRDQLEAKLARFEELERALVDPGVLADSGRLAHGDGERQRSAHGCLMSIVAWRRSSRM